MSYWSWIKTIVEPDGSEWITIKTARSHLRIAVEVNGVQQSHPDDDYIQSILIPGVREQCEQFTGLSFVNRTVEISSDALPEGGFELPFGPVYSITSVTYLDSTGLATVLDSTQYALSTYASIACMYRAYGITWPTPQLIKDAVKIRYVTGYSEDDGRIILPMPLKMAMLLMLTHYYKNRGETTELKLESIPDGAVNLMTPYRTRLGMA